MYLIQRLLQSAMIKQVCSDQSKSRVLTSSQIDELVQVVTTTPVLAGDKDVIVLQCPEYISSLAYHLAIVRTA